MKVKIVKCMEGDWYDGRIGEIFNAEESKNSPLYYLASMDGDQGYIDKNDVEIIEDGVVNKVQVQECQQPEDYIVGIKCKITYKLFNDCAERTKFENCRARTITGTIVNFNHKQQFYILSEDKGFHIISSEQIIDLHEISE